MKKVILFWLASFSGAVLADGSVGSDSGYHFNVAMGASPYTGILGFEVQRANWGLGVGAPGSISMKYFKTPDADSLYAGVFWNDSNNKEFNDYKDGIYFHERHRQAGGVGLGYRWLWSSGLNCSTGLATSKVKEMYTQHHPYTGQADGVMTKNSYFASLDLQLGYRF